MRLSLSQTKGAITTSETYIILTTWKAQYLRGCHRSPEPGELLHSLGWDVYPPQTLVRSCPKPAETPNNINTCIYAYMQLQISVSIYIHIRSYTIIYIAFAAVLMYVDRYTCTRAYTHKYTNVISHPTSTSTFVLVSEIHPSVRATMNLWAYIIDYIREWRLKS